MLSPLSNGSTVNRRQLLRTACCGFGGLALHSMTAGGATAGALSPRLPHYAAKAKRVIFLFMAGGPSQCDLFDEKPLITKNHAQQVTPKLPGTVQRLGIDQGFLAMKPIRPIRPRGESGMTISDLMPEFAKVADDICLLKATYTDNKAHGPACLQLHTGMVDGNFPSVGSWVSYGLGTENDNLPSFMTIQPVARDVRLSGSGFLPAFHQGTPVNVPMDGKAMPIKHLRDAGVKREQQLRRLAFTKTANEKLLGQFETDQQLEGMIESFELAFRMQSETPELVDLSGETQETLDLYGVGKEPTDRNGRAILMGRRMSEAGVRFVQVTFDGWDHHGRIADALPPRCAATDRPIAALIKDLKRRGLLDETLIVWSGEFGRTYWSQDQTYTSPFRYHGREHQQESYAMWMAGGGLKGGVSYGETDDFGLLPVNDSVHLHDVHATILHQLGLDHEKLTYRVTGRDVRLTDVYGNVVHDLIA